MPCQVYQGHMWLRNNENRFPLQHSLGSVSIKQNLNKYKLSITITYFLQILHNVMTH